MRILYLTEEAISFTDAMVRGGAIHVRNVVEGLRDRGHDVFLVDWNNNPERSYQRSLQPQTRFVIDPVRTLRKAVSVGRAKKVDVIVSKTRKTYLPGLAAARRLGVPHVVHVGSSLDATDGNGRLNKASLSARLRVPHSSYFVVGTNIADQLRCRGVERDQIRDVSNAVDVERFHPDRRDALTERIQQEVNSIQGPTVGFVGGLHQYKGIYDLATAVESCESDVTVLFAGDGPERAKLERRLDDRAVFLGAVPYEDMPAIYHAVDLFVLPSHTEGIPRVILEAQATATPVVATHVGGVPNVIDHGESGLLCKPRTPEDLGAAIEEVLDDSVLRAYLAENGRRRVVESYSWEEMYERYETYLSDVLSETPEGRA